MTEPIEKLPDHLADLTGAATQELEDRFAKEPVEDLGMGEAAPVDDGGDPAPAPEGGEGPAAAAPEGEAQAPEDPPTVESLQADLAELNRQNHGLRNEMIESRRRASEYRGQFEASQQAFQELASEVRSFREANEDPDPIKEDPAVQYMDSRFEQIQQQLHQMQQPPEGYELLQHAEAVAHQATQYAERYREVAPDWDEARMHHREVLRATQVPDEVPPDLVEGYLNGLETDLADRWLKAGRDPAAELYERARRVGFAGGQVAAAPASPPAGPTHAKSPTPFQQHTRLIERGLDQSTSLSAMRGSPGGANPGRLDRAQVSQLPKEQRLAIYGNADLMESLQVNGSVELPEGFFR